jgi:hypothetical protein
MTLFPLGGAGVGYTSALALLRVFACLTGFTVPLIGCVSGATGLLALDMRGGYSRVTIHAGGCACLGG